MRCLNRNKQKMYYATYVSYTAKKDGAKNETGENIPEPANPVVMYANISAARGTSEAEQFGMGLNYDKTVVTDDMDCPITETTVLWIDTMPVIEQDGTTKTAYDHVVRRVAKSINSITYAVQKVHVS